MNNRFKLGIIGGMGPMTTAVFLKMIVSETDAKCDQEHMPIVIEHCPGVPDRTEYILGKSKNSPVKPIIEAGKNMANAGATEIAIPCFTAHYFHETLEKEIPIPVINGIEEVAKNLSAKGITKAGVMATDGTVSANIFKTELEKNNIDCIYPDEVHQKKVMSMIYDHVKANRAVPQEMFGEVCDHLKASGAETVILGCTELSVIADGMEKRDDITDALLILTQRCIGDFKKAND